MKKLLLIISIIYSISSYSQIKTHGYIEFGGTEYSYTIYNQTSERGHSFFSTNLNYYANINLGFSYKKLYIINSIETNMQYQDGHTFHPNNVRYTFNIIYKFNTTFEAGYRHMCLHPMSYREQDPTINEFNGSYDKFYLKINY